VDTAWLFLFSRAKSYLILLTSLVTSIMYESKNQRLISQSSFVSRLFLHLALTLLLLFVSLTIGMSGYVIFENLSWVDAFLNASMLLGGMGPVNTPLSTAGKLFAGIYALYAGLVFIVSAALIFTPVVHRILHRFHLDDAR
jgi:hypothetical protein